MKKDYKYWRDYGLCASQALIAARSQKKQDELEKLIAFDSDGVAEFEYKGLDFRVTVHDGDIDAFDLNEWGKLDDRNPGHEDRPYDFRGRHDVFWWTAPKDLNPHNRESARGWGGSKQVSFEACAAARARMKDRISEYIRGYWNNVWVQVEVLDGDGEVIGEDTLGGIESDFIIDGICGNGMLENALHEALKGHETVPTELA